MANYSVRNCGSDRKPWLVEREGYQFPVAAFHEEHEAMRYMQKIIDREAKQCAA
jgi:hypothetical protein